MRPSSSGAKSTIKIGEQNKTPSLKSLIVKILYMPPIYFSKSIFCYLFWINDNWCHIRFLPDAFKKIRLLTNEIAICHYPCLSLSVAPKIIPFSFQDEHLFEGVLARISCVVYQGDLPLTILWKKDGRPISSDLGISIREIDDYSSILTIEKVETKHNGNFTCVVSNDAATVNYTAQLTVYGN